jgi:hypothetical protein
MKVSRPILLTFFFYSAIFVLFPSSPYNIWKWVDHFAGFFLYSPVLDFLAKFLYFVWKWVDQFCWLFFSTQQYSFFSLHLHTMYESESTNFADFFFLLSNIRSFPVISIQCMKVSRPILLTFFLHSPVLDFLAKFLYFVWKWVNLFADSIFYTQQFSIFQTKFLCFVWNSVNLYDDYFFCNIQSIVSFSLVHFCLC